VSRGPVAKLEDECLGQTPKRPAHPLGVSAVHRLLSNPYYVGVVAYAGETAIGRHEPLIDQATFECVQFLLLAGRHGERASKHEHYPGEERSPAQSAGDGCCSVGTGAGGGVYYEYFSCVNRIARGRRPIKCSSGH